MPSLRELYRGLIADLDAQVVLLSVSSLVMMLGARITSPILPLYAREFGVSYTGAGMLVAAFALGRLGFDYAGGVVADRVSPRLLGTTGALISTCAALLSARATSFEWLIAFRVLEGVGSAFYVVTIMGLIARTVPRERMGQAMAFYQSMILLGVSLGPAVGGVVAELTGSRRSPFYVMALLDLAVAGITLARVSNVVRGGTRVEARPSLRKVLRHTSSPAFAYVLTLTFLVFAVRSGTRATLIPLYGGEQGGLGESAIGLILSVSAFVNFVVLWHGGVVLDRRGRQRVALPALLSTAFLCALFSVSPSFTNLLITTSLFGVTFGYLAPAPDAMLADLTPSEMLRVTIGVYRTAGDFGLLIGPIALGWIAARASFEAAFLAAAAATLAVFLFGLQIPETLSARRSTRRGGELDLTASASQD